MGWGGEMWRVLLDLSLMRQWDPGWFSAYHHAKRPDALSLRSGKS